VREVLGVPKASRFQALESVRGRADPHLARPAFRHLVRGLHLGVCFKLIFLSTPEPLALDRVPHGTLLKLTSI
jgi:hypothetical protein